MLNRAYSLLEIKSVDESARIIRGIASTPKADRMGDVVEPKGGKYKLPIPLLWQHDSEQPIGNVTSATVTDKGIEIEAQLAPEGLLPVIDAAWKMIKAGLVRGLSIGFSPLKDGMEVLKDGSGLRFTSWEWLELSAVTIPANAQASITLIKSIDTTQMAATGPALPTVVRLDASPGVSGLSTTPTPPKGQPMKTIAEQIGAFEAKRAALAGSMLAVMTKSFEAGTTLDATEQETYDSADGEIKQIDAHIVRLKSFEKSQIAGATPIVVPGVVNAQSGADLRGGVISVRPNVEKGTAFARYVKTLAASGGNLMQAAEMAKKFDDTTPEVSLVLRSASNAGTTTDTNWASALTPYKIMQDEFIELLRPLTIIGRIPGFRRVPFNIKMPTQTGRSTIGWVGQAAPKPVGQLQFGTLTLDFTKAAGIIVISEELARLSTPSADTIVTSDLIAQMAQYLDQQFCDPSVAAVTGVSPASITNGSTALTATGTDANSLRADLRRLIQTFLSTNQSLGGAVLIMTEGQASAISIMVNALGQPEFPGLNATGGTLMGMTVITSESVTQVTAGSPPVTTGLMILMKPSEILLADDGQVTIDVSREASLQMDNAPVTPSASTVMINLWQHNLIGIRAERWINWVRRRPGAVAYVSNAGYITG